MSDRAIPVKYVLYSHYFAGEDDDYATWRETGSARNLTYITALTAHFRGLRELLKAPGHEGMMVIFYAAGYHRFLTALGAGENIDQLARGASSDPELGFARAVSDHVLERLREHGLADRVRFLTPLDLRTVLGRVNTFAAKKFQSYFLGIGKGIRYDAPKVVEAILRLRLIGMGVPVLRLDQDVIFRGDENKDIGDLGMFKAVACAVRAYRLRVEQPAISTFLFSASYNTRALLQASGERGFTAWSRAFATRVYPALIADPVRIGQIFRKPAKNRGKLWSAYVDDQFKKPDASTLLRQFYGLTQATDRLEVAGLDGLTRIGAHPLHAVISGALLCLSDGAILDLPPFSNFSNNVMWIDDHLKYSLHRAMNHFPAGDALRHEPALSDARLDDVTVTKARADPGFLRPNLPEYILGKYLPTLLYGTIVDSWITTNPLLKIRTATLDGGQQEAAREARETQHKAPLPDALFKALSAATFENSGMFDLRTDLEPEAIKRINIVRKQWSELKTARRKTFACYWAEGSVRDEIGSQWFNPKERLWEGMTTTPGAPITSLDDLNEPLRDGINTLINDTIGYVQWTRDWPQFVQIVRSIKQGDFAGDLSWRP